MKTVVIGVGVIGKVHLDVLTGKDYNVVAICDVDPSVFKSYGTIKAYTDYREMIDTEKPDVVHICTPHYLHTEMILYALERNVNVLCEKPLCIKKEDIPVILKAEEKSKAQLGVCFQNRYVPCMQYLKDYLADKTVLATHASVYWKRGREYYNSGEWRGTKKMEGGGVVINQAIHTIDLVEWFTGEPEYITASVSNLTLKDVIEVEDTAFVICEGKSNFIFSATNGCYPSFPIEIQVQTQEQVIRVFDNQVFINGEVIKFPSSSLYMGKPCYGLGHAPLIADFYDCVKTGRKFGIDGTEGSKALRLVLAAYESNGERIKIN